MQIKKENHEVFEIIKILLYTFWKLYFESWCSVVILIVNSFHLRKEEQTWLTVSERRISVTASLWLNNQLTLLIL